MNWLEVIRGSGERGAGLVFVGIVIGGMTAELVIRGWFGMRQQPVAEIGGNMAALDAVKAKEMVDRCRTAGMVAGAVIGWMWR